MADRVFNIAKGKVARYSMLPETADALIVVLLKVAETDLTLIDHDDLSVLLAGTSDEADFTNYARKTISASVTVTPDDTNERIDVDFPDQTWTSAGGALNNNLVDALVTYDNDTGAGTDSNIIPMTLHDFIVTTDGTDL